MNGAKTIEQLTSLFVRDLDRFIAQVESYADDDTLWAVGEGTLNSGGTLAAHAAGNLLHFVGSQLGGTDYVRDREAEFSGERRTREALVAGLSHARSVIQETLPGLSQQALDTPLPGAPEVFRDQSTLWFLIHLYGHLNWHLGQLDYHRRLLEGG